MFYKENKSFTYHSTASIVRSMVAGLHLFLGITLSVQNDDISYLFPYVSVMLCMYRLVYEDYREIFRNHTDVSKGSFLAMNLFSTLLVLKCGEMFITDDAITDWSNVIRLIIILLCIINIGINFRAFHQSKSKQDYIPLGTDETEKQKEHDMKEGNMYDMN